MERLFVYGTLRPGERAWWRVEPRVRAHRPAWCHGTMYAFAAGYPGIVLAGTTRIAGDLLELVDPAAALAALDAYEGDEFTRLEADVNVTSATLRAWVYVLREVGLAASGTPVPGGDWCVAGRSGIA